jgi:hypothetical protein
VCSSSHEAEVPHLRACHTGCSGAPFFLETHFMVEHRLFAENVSEALKHHFQSSPLAHSILSSSRHGRKSGSRNQAVCTPCACHRCSEQYVRRRGILCIERRLRLQPRRMSVSTWLSEIDVAPTTNAIRCTNFEIHRRCVYRV